MNHHVSICNIWAQSQYRRLELSGKTMCHVALWIVHTFHFFKAGFFSIGKSSNLMEMLDHRARKHTKSAGILQHIMKKVGGLERGFSDFPSIGNGKSSQLTNSLHHFSEGWRAQPPTR